MLKNTFIHIPGIGPSRENWLWTTGFQKWEDYLERCHECTLSPITRDRISLYLEHSILAVDDTNYRYFESLMPSGEMWRLYGELRAKTAFLDIETTGLCAGPNAITLIGLFDGLETKVFIQGINLEQFNDEIKKYQLIVTFNGKRFDVPFIRCVLGDLPANQAHLDLMYPLRRLGYRGGLKSVEEQLGIGREGVLRQIDGFMAVLLWREHERGNRAALSTLIRYNLEDVVNLQYLSDIVYNTSIARLPVLVDPLPKPQKYCLDDISFDGELVEYLLRQVHERWT
ncbi:MAG: ribonuclease H-like domain-containing protein [Dehalococcoidales bacterium]|nr:ribonuclease H-like domain-containing protein [Dehalococcoidales bacterium]